MPRKNPETKFKEKVQEDLKRIRCWHRKIQSVSVRGIPDVLMCKSGKFVALELKVDSPLTELQKYNLDLISKNGGYARVVTPNNWNEIFQEIQEL